MAQKPKEQIKHDNLAAQIVVMKGELGSVNKELSLKLTERNSLENGLLSRSLELDKINKTIEEVKNWSKDKTKELERKEINLNEREDIVTKKEISNKERLEKDERLHQEKIKSYSAFIGSLDSIMKVKQFDLDELEQELENKLESKHLISNSIKQLSKEGYITQQNITSMRKELSEEILDYDKRLERKDKKLKEIESDILKKQQLIENPAKALEQERKRLINKKKNLDILIDRFNQRFKEKFPNQELKL